MATAEAPLPKARNAFERVSKNKVEYMVVLGPQLEREKQFPSIKGKAIDPKTGKITDFNFADIKGVAILSFVNELGSKDCQKHAANAEKAAKKNSKISVFTISKQTPEQLLEIARKEGLTHTLISIDHDAAVTLGVALEADEGQDPEVAEFWNNALLRSLFVIAGMENVQKQIVPMIKHVEQLADQAKQPNFEVAVIAAKKALRKQSGVSRSRPRQIK